MMTVSQNSFFFCAACCVAVANGKSNRIRTEDSQSLNGTVWSSELIRVLQAMSVWRERWTQS